jgi:serine/threonine-protein kinase
MAMAEKVGPFRVLSQIAKGGMGRVYLARHEEKGRLVAIKVLPEKFLADRKRSQYLVRELNIAQKLRHPNVVDIYGLHREKGIGYLIMEYLDGGNLRRHIRSRELSLSKILEIILKICGGLHYIHNHRFEDGRFHSIIHMDIKPENILLSKNGRLKVADFGLSLSEDFWTLRKSKTRAGTPFYMSPEQIQGKTLDVRTDIYSLGLVIYELLTGQLPYKGQDRDMYLKMVISRKTKPAPPSYIDAKIPYQFDKITMKALKKKAEARYQTVAEMMLDLRRLSPILMPDDYSEEFRFMRSVQLNSVKAPTTEVPVEEYQVKLSTNDVKPSSERNEAPADTPDSGDGDSMVDGSTESEGVESEANSDKGEELSQDLLQLRRELIYAEDPGKAAKVRTAETKEPVDAEIEDASEKEITEPEIAEAEEILEKEITEPAGAEADEPVGEFLSADEIEIEAGSEDPEDSQPVPVALGENSDLVEGELVCEAEQGGNGEAGDLMLEAGHTGEESESDGFSSLEVEEIESFIFIGRRKG